MKIPEKLSDMIPYTPDMGEYKIRLDANESFLLPNKNIAENITEACKGVKLNRYPDPMAAKVCKAFGKVHNINEKLITAGNGSDELISVITSSFIEKGDKVLCFTPDFSMYSFYCGITENPVITMQKNDDFSIDTDAVISTIKENDVKMLIFSNPCNPTSVGLEREEVVKIIKSTEALIVLDEAYMDFWNQSLLDCVADFDNLIILKTCSKAFGSAAIRLGFAIANERLTSYIRMAKSPYNVNSLTQVCGEVILSDKEGLLAATEKVIKERDYLYNCLKELAFIDFMPKPCTNFVAVRTKNSEYIYEKLKEYGILVRITGGFLRITAGSREENEELISAIKRIGEKL